MTDCCFFGLRLRYQDGAVLDEQKVAYLSFLDDAEKILRDKVKYLQEREDEAEDVDKYEWTGRRLEIQQILKCKNCEAKE